MRNNSFSEVFGTGRGDGTKPTPEARIQRFGEDYVLIREEANGRYSWGRFKPDGSPVWRSAWFEDKLQARAAAADYASRHHLRTVDTARAHRSEDRPRLH